MKKLYFLLLCFGVGSAVAQQVVVANLKENIVYCGVDNPLSALVEGYPCSSVVLTVDNGKIEKRSCGQFIYKPANVGSVRIKIWIHSKKKLEKVGERLYTIKPLPLPVAVLHIYDDEGRMRPFGGMAVKRSYLKAGITGITAHFTNFDYEVFPQIVSYTVNGVKNGEVLFKEDNMEAIFNPKMYSSFALLQEGNHLVISNIICTIPNQIQLKPLYLEFTIIE